MTNDKVSKTLKSNVPMWEIDGNEKMKSYAEEIANISFQLKSLEEELKETNENVESADQRINIYLSNILGLPGFEQSKHAILIKENYHIEVFNVEDVERDEEKEISLDDLPEPLLSHKSSQKQSLKILNYLREYNDLVDDFNITMEDYAQYADEHQELWDEVKESVKKLKYLKLETKEEDIEDYDEEKHVLLITQNDTTEAWGFRYIRKEDEDEFNSFLQKEFDEEE